MKKIILIVLIAIAAVAGGAALWVHRTLGGDAVTEERSIYVAEGSDFRMLAGQLAASGAIRDMARFERVARMLGANKSVRAGHYRLKKGTSYKHAVRTFHRGWQSPVRLTFNNIRTSAQLAGRISAQLEQDSAAFARILLSDSVAAHYGFDRRTFIAMFIPDTYEFYWDTSPEKFVERMHREWERFWDHGRRERLAATGLTRTEAVTLASIVYEETNMTDEMPTVAGVYINRLRIGMPLQADPTVKFAIGDFSLRRILHRHLEVDSPYNTYRYAGLPPGPIAMPSVKAIDAVLNYRSHKYLYFCARADFSGYHSFATTLSEHNRNAEAYRRALNARGIR